MMPHWLLIPLISAAYLSVIDAALSSNSPPPKKKKRSPFPDEHLPVANEMVNRLEDTISKLRISLEITRNQTLERSSGSVKAPETHGYAALPDLPFSSALVNRQNYEEVCGSHLATLGARQRKMMLGKLPPPIVVLAAYSPLDTEGIADFFKQAALAAGIAATWRDRNIAVHIEWLAAEPHLSATLQSAGLIDTWYDHRTKDGRNRGGSAMGSGELVRRCQSEWALRGCEIVDMEYVKSQFLDRRAEATANAFAMEFRHVFRTTVPPHDRRPLRTGPWHPDLAPACLLNGIFALTLDAPERPAVILAAVDSSDGAMTGSDRPSEGRHDADAKTPPSSSHKSSEDDGKCVHCETRDFPTALRLMRSAQRLSVGVYFRSMQSEHHNQATSRNSLLAERLPGNRTDTWPLQDRWAYNAAAAAALRLERTYSRAFAATTADKTSTCTSPHSRCCCSAKISDTASEGERDHGCSDGTIPEVVWVVVSDDIALRETFCDEYHDPQNGRFVVSSGSAGRHSRPNLADTHPVTDEPPNQSAASEECSGSGSSDPSTCSSDSSRSRSSSSSTTRGSGYARSVAEAVQDWWLLGEADVAVLSPWRGDGGSYPRTAVARTARLHSTFTPPGFMARLQVLVERAQASSEEALLAANDNGTKTAPAAGGSSSSVDTTEVTLSHRDAEACPDGCLGGSKVRSELGGAVTGTAAATAEVQESESCNCGEVSPLGIWPLR